MNSMPRRWAWEALGVADAVPALVTRYEYKADNFLGFVQLACIVILVRRVV